MNKDYPLYPPLTVQGEEEAQRVMDNFKVKLAEVMQEVLGQLYTEVSWNVASDHWTNYREALMNGIQNYKGGLQDKNYVYKDVRKAIYKNHKEEIVKDLNQDLVKENEKLKEQLEKERSRRYDYP